MRRLAVLMLLVTACSGGGDNGGNGGTGPTRQPSTIVLVRGGDQTVPAGTQMPGQVGVTVSDGRGILPGVTVTFAAASGSGSVDQTTVITNERGEAGVNWTAGQTAGPQTLTATVSPLAPLAIHATAVAGPVALVTAVAGNHQFGVVSRPLAVRPAALAADQFGNPIANLRMTFSVGAGGGSLTGTDQTTDMAGRATLGGWTMGPRAVTYQMYADAGGVTALFDATATPAAVVPVTPVDQSANAGTPALSLPVVEARDGDGHPMDGVTIDFAVIAGGGRIVGGSTRTDAAGRAHPVSWVLGATAGPNEVAAGTPGLAATAAFRAAGIDALPTALTAVRGAAQQGFPGNVAAQLPTVRLTDPLGKPVSGKAVTFELLSGGGRIVRAATTSDQAGEARLGGWRLGPAPGLNQVRAVAAGLSPVSFSATAVAKPAPGFLIDLRVQGVVSTTQQTAFTAAAAHWSRLILGDIGDVPIAFGADPAGCYPALHETINDVAIYIYVEAIDGVGGVLGAAGPCLARDDTFLPVIGIMILDQADLNDLELKGQLEAVITHEMGHVLGFGPLVWDLKGLMTGAGSTEPLFLGPSAAGAYSLLAGPTSPFSRPAVPLESTGGPGTRDAHWRESVFDAELMTGFIDDGANPLSALTAASFRDIGYVVDDTATDDYNFLAAVRAASSGPVAVPHTATWTGPVRLVNRAGRVVRTLR